MATGWSGPREEAGILVGKVETATPLATGVSAEVVRRERALNTAWKRRKCAFPGGLDVATRETSTEGVAQRA